MSKNKRVVLSIHKPMPHTRSFCEFIVVDEAWSYRVTQSEFNNLKALVVVCSGSVDYYEDYLYARDRKDIVYFWAELEKVKRGRPYEE